MTPRFVQNASDIISVKDEDHIWFNGKQFVSLHRFIEMKNSELKELMILQDKVLELQDQVEAYKVLLNKQTTCTPKEWDTCGVEKRGCPGCYYKKGE